jgi:hypothetical protein
MCVSVCGPAMLLGCRPIRVRVESIYCTTSLCNITSVHPSTFSINIATDSYLLECTAHSTIHSNSCKERIDNSTSNL